MMGTCFPLYSIRYRVKVKWLYRAPADHPFRISQLHIIVDKTDLLLHDFASRLSNNQIDPNSPQYPSMTRFFAHLCLFMQMSDEVVSPFVTQVILEAYLSVLEVKGQRKLIAMYAGALGDNAVDRYAHYLSTMELSVDSKARGDTLADAAKYGLDTVRVAEKAAEMSVSRALEALASSSSLTSLPNLAETEEVELDGAEEVLFRALEWTTFQDETHALALKHANIALRYFLSTFFYQTITSYLFVDFPLSLLPDIGKVSVARVLLRTHQSTVSHPPKGEFNSYVVLFNAWDVLSRAHAQTDIMTMQLRRESRAQSVHDYKKALEAARTLVCEDVLKQDWLIFSEDEWEEIPGTYPFYPFTLTP